MNKIKELENKMAELSKELEELKKEKEKTDEWTLEWGENYWFINSFGFILSANWNGCTRDYFRKDYLKIFKTEAEAQEYFDYIKAKKKYSYEFTQEEWKNENIGKYYIYYDFEDKRLEVGMSLLVKRVGEIYVKSKEDAKEFIDKYKKQILKYEFGIEEE